MGDAFIISGLKERRSAIAGEIADLYKRLDKLQADLVHVDGVLALYVRNPYEGRSQPGQLTSAGFDPKRTSRPGN